MKRTNWTREETIIAFNVYCKIPFKDSSSRHPLIIEFASILGRSPSALNMKIGNFGRLDPELKKRGIVGLANGSKLEEVIWNEFNGNWENLAYESERLISEFQDKPLEQKFLTEFDNIPEGKEADQIVKTRVNQSFFRSAVLSSYNGRCCITGLSIPNLLIASHIIPWSHNAIERLNPRNGLCLNSLHDKAFDKGYITITPNFSIKVSKYLYDFEQEDVITEFFLKYEGKKINLPERFLPTEEILDYHGKNIFIK